MTKYTKVEKERALRFAVTHLYLFRDSIPEGRLNELDRIDKHILVLNAIIKGLKIKEVEP